MQAGGRPESVCEDAGGMRGNLEPGESSGPPQCNAKPAGSVEVDEVEEEGCRSRENPPERNRQSYSDAVTDALLPKQHSSGQEGEVERQNPALVCLETLSSSHTAHQKPTTTFNYTACGRLQHRNYTHI